MGNLSSRLGLNNFFNCYFLAGSNTGYFLLQVTLKEDAVHFDTCSIVDGTNVHRAGS